MRGSRDRQGGMAAPRDGPSQLGQCAAAPFTCSTWNGERPPRGWMRCSLGEYGPGDRWRLLYRPRTGAADGGRFEARPRSCAGPSKGVGHPGGRR
jgi:hypothetical protein